MSSFDWSTQVRWPTVRGPPEDAILLVAATVLSLRDPFAPYVTDTNAGSCGANASTAAQRTGSSSSDRGGKNSNENNGPVADASNSPTDAARGPEVSVEEDWTSGWGMARTLSGSGFRALD
jgi:hypothetical protein